MLYCIKINAVEEFLLKDADFSLFLNDIAPDDADRALNIHQLLLDHHCELSLKAAANGQVASYKDASSGAVVANLVSRKTGPRVRIYADNAQSYLPQIEALPENLKKSIVKAPNCKQLADPPSCNAKCKKGYVFVLGGETYKKCRYNCFLLPLSAASLPYIKTLLTSELRARAIA